MNIFIFSHALAGTYTGCPQSTGTPQYILNGWKYQHHTSTKSIIILFMGMVYGDENVSPNFEKRGGGWLHIFNGNPDLVTCHWEGIQYLPEK